MPEQFQAGDLVHLISGGPTMTVEYDPEHQRVNGHIDCVWFIEDRIHHESFNPKNLEAVYKILL